MFKYLHVFLFFCCLEASAQFDIGISHGWMVSHNKKEIKSGLSSSPFADMQLKESNLKTRMYSIDCSYQISKSNAIRTNYRRGQVGSTIDGVYFRPGLKEL